MENLLLIIKKAPLVTWKAFLVLWALFLGFIGLVIKLIEFVGQLSNSPVGVGTFTMNGGRSISSEEPVVNKVRTYQNGVDGPKRNPGTTFYR